MNFLKIAVSCLAISSSVGAAVTPVPAADVAGAKDPAYLGRFAGAKALTYSAVDFDSLTLPLSALVAVAGQRDDHNNQVFAPPKKLELEGRRTHIVYLLPEGTAPLAAIRNYQNAAAAKGGKTLFECKDTECGGGQSMSGGGGGRQSLAMNLWPWKKVTDKHNSPAHCAQAERFTEQ